MVKERVKNESLLGQGVCIAHRAGHDHATKSGTMLAHLQCFMKYCPFPLKIVLQLLLKYIYIYISKQKLQCIYIIIPFHQANFLQPTI